MQSYTRKLLTIMLISLCGWAATAETLCDGTLKERAIARPLPGNSNKAFAYKYQILCTQNPTAPTMIFIPGGPGGSSFNDSDQINRAKKLGYNIVLTAPRGVTDNHDYFDKGGKDEDLNTELVADDIASIVADLNLRYYSLYGHSYGTVVATIANKKIEERGLARPVATILEGVLAKTFKPDEQAQAAEKALLRAKETAAGLGKCLECEIEKIEKANDLRPKDMGSILDMMLTFGQWDNGSTNPELTDTDKLTVGDTTLDLRFTINRIKSGKEMGGVDRRFHKAISCSEISPNGRQDTLYKNGKLKSGKGSCDKNSLTRPYDSKNWQISSGQVYYLAGAQDTATPLNHAQEHFKNQKNPNKNFICVPKGGHEPAIANLSETCTNDLLVKMLTGSKIDAMDTAICSNRIRPQDLNCN